MKRKKERKASITVEAALVVPIVLMVIFLLISLDFYVHDKAYFTLGAYETALTGNSFRYVSEEEGERGAKEKSSRIVKDRKMPGQAPESFVRLKENETEAGFKGSIVQLWGRGIWEYEVSGTVRRIRPEETIRRMRVVENAFT